jgi:hypothetical protein
MIKSQKKSFTIEFTSPILGTVCKNQEVYKTYIASKAPIPENGAVEVEDVKEAEEKGWTGFLADENGFYISSHMIIGFIKNACKVMTENGALKKIAAYKTWLDSCVFAGPRKLHFGKTEADFVVERPLRAMTAQGPRIALARSDAMNEGQRLTFEIEVLDNSKGITLEMIEELLEYGRYCGLGQWRGSGAYGQFKVVA